MSNAPAADYTVCVIETLARSNQFMGISDISHATGINKNAVSRVLGALTESGWVYQENLKYQLTLKPFRLASSALGRISFCSAVQPILTRMWEQTGDSCYAGILENDAVLYLGHIDSVRDLKIAGRVGGSYPLECSAPGKVLLAYGDADYRRSYLQGKLGWEEARIEKMEQDLAQVRKRGWAIDVEEYGPGILCFAAPVFGVDEKVAGTIGVSTSVIYSDEKSIIAQQGQVVLAAARELSQTLGAIL